MTQCKPVLLVSENAANRQWSARFVVWKSRHARVSGRFIEYPAPGTVKGQGLHCGSRCYRRAGNQT